MGSVVVVAAIAFVKVAKIDFATGRQVTYSQISSCGQLAERMNKEIYYPYMYDGVAVEPPMPATDSSSEGATKGGSYSATNIQVAGVDEADIVKTDGKYIYVAATDAVYVLRATATGLDNYLAKITLDSKQTPRGLFVSGKQLVIFADSYGYGVMPMMEDKMGAAIAPTTRAQSYSAINVYDISNVEKPVLDRVVAVEGGYQTSRMIGSRVYLVGNYYPNYYQQVDVSQVEELIPRVSDSSRKAGSFSQGEFQQMAQCSEIAEFGDEGRNFITVVTLDLNNNQFLGKQTLIGNAQTVYMSQDSLVLAATDYMQQPVVATDVQCTIWGCPPIAGQSDPRTILFKLKVTDSGIEFSASGAVPGTLLNQFSLDEHSGYLRVVTTIDNWGVRENLSVNNLYVLDGTLSQVGAVEDLGKGERVYSARFMGDRAYMVTFRTVDPLFVIDLSKPTDPRVLGQLKIPGFSDYLHPYDDTHIIGFGKDTEETITGGVTTNGLKIALFDVTDPTNPVEVSKLILGGKYSDSNLLYDHKALLFDREKHLMVMPVTLYPTKDAAYNYNNPEFYGFVAMNIDLKSGISERGRVPAYKAANDQFYYYGNYNQRSLYVGDVLFTWDGRALTASSLQDLHKLSQLVLNNTDYYGGVVY